MTAIDRNPHRAPDGQPATDPKLLQMASEGDAAAFHELVDRHAASLFRLARAMTGNAADAEDVMQETFLGAFQRMSSFQGRSSVRTGLVGILSRQAARSHRWRLRRPAVAFEEVAEEPRARAGQASDASRASDARMDVGEALGRLSSEHRQVLVLREVEGMTYAEIAEVLGVPLGTVESRLFRARQELKEQLSDYLA